MAAQPSVPPTRRFRTLLGGMLGGILGTSGMIGLGLAVEAAAGLPLHELIPELELGFGGPVAGAGVLGPEFALPVHYLHGVLLGLVLAGFLLLDDRLEWARQVPVWASGLLFGGVVSAVVFVILAATHGGAPTPGLAGLVVFLHFAFGGLAGLAIHRVRDGILPRRGDAPGS